MGKTLGVGAFAKVKSMNKIKFCKRKSIKRNKNDEKFKSS